MTQTRQPLDAGDAFPGMTLALADGSSMQFPQDAAGRWGVLLMYRGHW